MWCGGGGEDSKSTGHGSDNNKPPKGKVVTLEDTNHLWFYNDVSQESVQELVTALHQTATKVRKATEARGAG